MHERMSPMSLFLFLQRWPACLVRLSWIVCEMGGARGVMVIVVGNGHSDMNSNPGRD